MASRASSRPWRRRFADAVPRTPVAPSSRGSALLDQGLMRPGAAPSLLNPWKTPVPPDLRVAHAAPLANAFRRRIVAKLAEDRGNGRTRRRFHHVGRGHAHHGCIRDLRRDRRVARDRRMAAPAPRAQGLVGPGGCACDLCLASLDPSDGPPPDRSARRQADAAGRRIRPLGQGPPRQHSRTPRAEGHHHGAPRGA